MNFCTRCESYYTRPGSCNCFIGRYTTGDAIPRTHCATCGLPCRAPEGTSAMACRCHKGTTVTFTPPGEDGIVYVKAHRFDDAIVSVYGHTYAASCNLAGCTGGCGICAN